MAACASAIGSTESTVNIQTNPAQARCLLKGYEFQAQVTTPVTLGIPHTAAPVTVSCIADGFRSTSYSLDVEGDGWIWGNTAFMVASGGVAVLGALVDEGRGAGKGYAETVHYDLQPERGRALRVRERSAGTDMLLNAQ